MRVVRVGPAGGVAVACAMAVLAGSALAADGSHRPHCRSGGADGDSRRDRPCRAEPGSPVELKLKGRPTGDGHAGEGLLELTMAAPGASWRDPADTSVVVDVTLDGDPDRRQTFVRFAGDEPFRYSGFTGPIQQGRHRVTVAVNEDLSPPDDPVVRISRASLRVVTRDDPQHAALAHAPVLFGRAVSAHSDSPLLTYAERGDGGRRYSYTTVFSNEDSGSGVVAAYLWGTYGRMTDIEGSAEVTLNRRHRFESATYQSCEGCPDPYPEGVTGVEHSTSEFAGNKFFGHPILRISTGNNVFDDSGTSAFRFQQALVDPPGDGELRERVMDRHPWTYRVMDQEVQRERAAERSASPLSFQPGDTHQYAVVDLDVRAQGTRSIAFELQLEGDPAWYSNDYRQTTGVIGSSFPFYNGGHGRTVVKLPAVWHQREIARIRLRLNHSPEQQPALDSVESLRLFEVTRDFEVVERELPDPDPAVTQVTVLDGGVLP